MIGFNIQNTDSIKCPAIPSLYVNAKAAYLLSVDGEVSTLSHARAAHMVHDIPVLVCHTPYTCKQLGVSSLVAFDVLELFAFVHPATFCVPTPTGLCKALGVTIPDTAEDYPLSLMNCVYALLSDIRQDTWRDRADPIKIAGVMGQNGKGWPWTSFIFSAFGKVYNEHEIYVSKADLNIWKNLPEWAENAPPPPASHAVVTGEDVQKKLVEVLGFDAERRDEQRQYASLIADMFTPKDNENPIAILAEAGTGVGKTLGYLCPASIWAQKNKGSVWVSTYTKNLQRQINQELDKIYPDRDMKDSKVAIRKGRENYLCLLNFEDMTTGVSLAKHANVAIAAGIMARWAAATKDGDISGGDFPGWITGLLGAAHTISLADRRGECIYSACNHYHRCFVERSVRKARHADIVVANHALVMIQTADASPDSDLPRHYIFDEGHHLFDAADSAYAGHLTALETHDLRRWIRGHEGGKKSRARGLKRRAEDCVAEDTALHSLVQDILEKARVLTADGWQARFKEKTPKGDAEIFLYAIYAQVQARAEGDKSAYSMETDTHPVMDDVKKYAFSLKKSLFSIQEPMEKLANGLRKKLNDQADTLESDMRKRIDALVHTLGLRARMITGWVSMLEMLVGTETSKEFVDWMEIEKNEGRVFDIGLYRHWVDPMVPFAASLRPHAHGVAVTSATLRDGTDDDDENWRVAQNISGLSHLTADITQEKFASPFDYAASTKIFVINDVKKDDLSQVSSAYQILFLASGGGALGLFTAISRLRSVHNAIASNLEEKGLHLYAQHVDTMDNGTLVDVFRDDINACLLGTDAVRDGVDVPGDSLRLIVFDRVPWPRPTILHRARRDAFGKKQYDDRITRLKLKQAFGRLIRRAGDKGVFVMLDSMLPSRLYGAFPQGVEVQKIGLAQAADEIRKFLKNQTRL